MNMKREQKNDIIIRKAVKADIHVIADTYTRLLTYEQKFGSNSNWKLGIYPTIGVAEEMTNAGQMYVLEYNNTICGSMGLNKKQPPEYAGIDWQYKYPTENVLVIHTLCIPPDMANCGYATRMIEYAKEQAIKSDCRVIRIDTFVGNKPARALYLKNGFRIAGYGDIMLHGLIPEKQVYLEYLL